MGANCSSSDKKKRAGSADDGAGRRVSSDSVPYAPPLQQNTQQSQQRPQSAPTSSHAVATAQLSTASTIDGHSVSSNNQSKNPVEAKKEPAPLAEDDETIPEVVRKLLYKAEVSLPLTHFSKVISLYVISTPDLYVERDYLLRETFPALRVAVAEQHGWALNVIDVQYALNHENIDTVALRSLCAQTISRIRQQGHVITLALLNEKLETRHRYCLPSCVDAPSFHETLNALPDESTKKLLNTWYTCVNGATYRLKSPTACGVDNYLEQWTTLIDNLKQHMPPAVRDRLLMSILEEQLETLIYSVCGGDDGSSSGAGGGGSALASGGGAGGGGEEGADATPVAFWVERRYTHCTRADSSEHPSNDSWESKRYSQMRARLEDCLPEPQKGVIRLRYGLEANTEDFGQYLSEMSDIVRRGIEFLVEQWAAERNEYDATQPCTGLSGWLLASIHEHLGACKSLVPAALSAPQSECLERVQRLVEDTAHGRPVVVAAPQGWGKSAFAAAIATKYLMAAPKWRCIVRFAHVGIEARSTQRLLRSIVEHMCALNPTFHPSIGSQSIEEMCGREGGILGIWPIDSQPRLMIVVDGLCDSGEEVTWLPVSLPPNVRIIFTVTTGSVAHVALKSRLDASSIIEAATLSESQMKVVCNSLLNSVSISNDTLYSQLHTIEAAFRCMHHAAMVAYQASMPYPVEKNVAPVTLDECVNTAMDKAIRWCGKKVVHSMLAIVANLRFGLSEGEAVEILTANPDWWKGESSLVVHTQATTVPYVVLAAFWHTLWPLFRLVRARGHAFLSVRSREHLTAIEKILDQTESATALSAAIKYFQGKLPHEHAMDEVGWYQLRRDGEKAIDSYIFNVDWLQNKTLHSDPYTILEEIDLVRPSDSGPTTELSAWRRFIQLSSSALRYDGSQLYSQIYARFHQADDVLSQHRHIKALYEVACKAPLASIFILDSGHMRKVTADGCTEAPVETSPNFVSALYTIADDKYHLVGHSYERQEIIVWDVYQQKATRTLTGVTQPRDIRMIDSRRALVLCHRELRVYNLDDGQLLVKLKGVMNQQMAYFGLHSQDYVVALSRNRMYVNMLNLNSGDLETTFKVGEDRFLNSLLVSGNGKICVCGDETQKPFPLLVWDLENRKLLYDLRIPHHEFLTRMSAISADGHYVVCVCRELSDTSPNFIIVYDLQSGTLFKKWKPQRNSCSIAISSQGGFVLNGLDNAYVLVWDLTTGAKRLTLLGHTSPVDCIRLDAGGQRALTWCSQLHLADAAPTTGSKAGGGQLPCGPPSASQQTTPLSKNVVLDRSLRVWDIQNGTCLVVWTPDIEVICAELMQTGDYVVLACKGTQRLHTLQVAPPNSTLANVPLKSEPYGKPELSGAVVDVSQQEPLTK